ncbi:MAG: PEGA domain-containing protein [Deltaproteobacteria bacterium]|nr:PEGA domain-containing protein [Deltaproteobacteria bacterium]
MILAALAAVSIFAAGKSGPAVLPFSGEAKAAGKATAALVQAAQEAQIGHKSPKQIETELMLPLRPAVQGCTGEIVCLTQIGGTIGAAQIIVGEVKGKSATVRVISVADAALVRTVEVALGEDARSMLRAFKTAVLEIFAATKPGEIVLGNVPEGGIVTVDGEAFSAGAKISVKPGFRQLKVMGEGGEPFQKEIYVRPGESAKIKVNLLPGKSSEPALVVPKKEKPAPDAALEVPLVAVAPPKPEKTPVEPKLVDIKPEAKPEPKPEPKPEAKTEPKLAEVKPEPKPEPKLVEVKPESKRPAGKKAHAAATAKAAPASEPVKLKEIVAAPVDDTPALEAIAAPKKKSTIAPLRVSWIIALTLTSGALITGGVFGVMQASTGAVAQAEPVQVRAAQMAATANTQTDVANAMWITAGVLGAATITLFAIDLAQKHESTAGTSLSVSASPSRLALTGRF